MYDDKDYSEWMLIKRKIQHSAAVGDLVGYHEGDVYWMCLGENVGAEQDGKSAQFSRPVLIVKGFSRHLALGIPLTSRGKAGKYYSSFFMRGANKKSTALLSQIRAIDISRISGKRLGKIDRLTLEKIRSDFIKMLLK